MPAVPRPRRPPQRLPKGVCLALILCMVLISVAILASMWNSVLSLTRRAAMASSAVVNSEEPAYMRAHHSALVRVDSVTGERVPVHIRMPKRLRRPVIHDPQAPPAATVDDDVAHSAHVAQFDSRDGINDDHGHAGAEGAAAVAGGAAAGAAAGGGRAGGGKGKIGCMPAGASVSDYDGDCPVNCPAWLKEAWPSPSPAIIEKLVGLRGPADLGAVERRARGEGGRSYHDLCYRRIPLDRFYSQDGEDFWLLETFFSDETRAGHSGTYVEVGAVDGVHFSNTLVLDTVLGWRGVNVEASPPNHENLQRNRPHAANAKYGVCEKQQLLRVYGQGPSADANGARLQGDEAQRSRKRYSVPCMPMRDIFKSDDVDWGVPDVRDRLRLDGIDFMSIDIEGQEVGVVRSHDFGAMPVGVLMVEQNPGVKKGGLKPCLEDDLRAALHAAGMCLFESNVGHANEVYVNRTQFALMRRQPPPHMVPSNDDEGSSEDPRVAMMLQHMERCTMAEGRAGDGDLTKETKGFAWLDELRVSAAHRRWTPWRLRDYDPSRAEYEGMR